MDERPTIFERIPVFTLAILGLLVATAVGIGIASSNANVGGDDSYTSVELTNHNPNDGKDNCPNDGNAGKGNDNKGSNGGCRQHPPSGSYGNAGGGGNPNDGKDNCPNDGNAGKGDDTHGPNGGCKTKQ